MIKFITENWVRTIMLATAGLLLLFSGVMLFKISNLNQYTYDTCEPREYVAWTKEEKIPISEERRSELLREKRNIELRIATTGSSSPFIHLFDERNLDSINDILEKGYEVFQVPDEERREKSRQEVENYETCLRNKNMAEKRLPVMYKFLYIGDTLILVTGALATVAFKKRD